MATSLSSHSVKRLKERGFNQAEEIALEKNIFFMAPFRIDDIVHKLNVIYLTLKGNPLVPQLLVKLLESVSGLGNGRIAQHCGYVCQFICRNGSINIAAPYNKPFSPQIAYIYI